MFNKTKFKNPPMIPVAANPSSGEKIGLKELITEFEKHILLPEEKQQRDANEVCCTIIH